MYLTSFGDRCKQRMEAAVAGYQNWKVRLLGVHMNYQLTMYFLTHWHVHIFYAQVDYRSGDYVEEFGKDNIVFLAAESPNVLAGLSQHCL